MSELTLQVPETLHAQLNFLAEQEGVTLDQYILYALTNQVSSGYTLRRLSTEEVQQQHVAFNALRARWQAVASDRGVDELLAAREIADPEPGLTPELIAKVQQKIAAARRRQQVVAAQNPLAE